PSGGTLSGTIPVAAAAGVASFNDLSIDTPGTGYTLTATSGTLTQATSNAFNITAGPPPPATHLAFGVQPSNTQVGATITPAVTVTALDEIGRTACRERGAVSVAGVKDPDGGTLTGNATANAVNGVAMVPTQKMDKVGIGSTVSIPAGTLTRAQTCAFTISAAPPPPATHLAFGVQPSNTQVGATITPAVTVTALDASGNTVPSFTGAISLALGNAGGATLSGNGPVNAVNGVATFANLTIDKVGTGYTLTAPSFPTRRSSDLAFNITAAPPPPATHLAFGVQPSNT